MFATIFSTIHISSTSVRMTTVKGKSVHTWAATPLEPGLVRDGKITDVVQVANVIDSLFSTTEAPKNNVIVTISGLPYTYRKVDLPKMKPEQVEAAMKFNLPNEFTVPLENLYVSWTPINTKEDSEEYFVVGVDRQFIDNIIEVFTIVGISDWSLDIQVLALARAAAQQDAVVVSLDYDYMEMVIVQDGKIFDMHSANMDTEPGDFRRDNYFKSFSQELVKLISYHHSKHNGDSQIGDMPIVLTGEVLADSMETTGAEELLDELRDATGYPVQYMETTVPYPESFVPTAYGTNIGLALRKLKSKSKSNGAFSDIKLDLLQGEYAKKPQTLSFRYVILPALLVITVVGVITFTNTHSNAKAYMAELDSELVRAEEALQAAQLAEAEALDIQTKINNITANLEASRSERDQLLANKGRYAPTLSQVTASLPSDTDFEVISINNETINISGLTANPYKVINYVRSLENTGYTSLNIQSIGDPGEGDYPFTIVIGE